MTLKHLRSSTANKRPQPSGISEGQLAINTASGSPGLFFKDSASNLVKVGPVHVGSGAPNASPASGGTSGNSIGEQWLDTSGGTYVFKIWDGSAWRSEAGEFVNTTGDTMTGALGIIAGSASTPGLFFSGDANSGLYSPGADQVAISTNGAESAFFAAGSGRLAAGAIDFNATTFALTGGGATEAVTVTKSGVDTISLGVDGSGPRITSGGDLRFLTNSAERLRITSAGRLGLGTSTPAVTLDVANVHGVNNSITRPFRIRNYGQVSATGYGVGMSFFYPNGTTSDLGFEAAAIDSSYTSGGNFGNLIFSTNNNTGVAERMRITSAGNVGIGTSSPQSPLHVVGSSVTLEPANPGNVLIKPAKAGGAILIRQDEITTDRYLAFGIVDNLGAFGESSRLDNSGRLLVGTSTARSNLFNGSYNPLVQIETSGDLTNRTLNLAYNNAGSSFGGAILSFTTSRGSTAGSNTLVANNDELGTLNFAGTDGTKPIIGANVMGAVDGTPGANDMPGRLVFSTTADGASSPTERMRISSAGTTTLTSAASTAPFIANIGASEAARIDSSGNLLVGGTSNSLSARVLAENASGNQIASRYTSVATYYLNTTSGGDFEINKDGSGRLRIDSSGRLLVGTSSGSGTNLLQIQGSTAASTGIGGIALRRGVAPSGMGEGSIMGYLDFGPNDGGIGCQIVGVADETQGTNDYPGRLVFSTTADGASSPTERMRIDSAGAFKTSANGTYKFPLGTTEITHNDATSSVQLIASNTSFAGDAATISTYRNTTNDTYKFLACIRQGFAVALEIRDDGDVYNVNGTYGSLSDVKLKENIVDAQSQWDDIKQLRVRNYNFKPETNNSTHKQIGVIAQELETVSPGLVNTVSDRDEDGNDLGTVTKSVNYSVLYMKAVKALQEAMERIEVLEQRLTDAGIA